MKNQKAIKSKTTLVPKSFWESKNLYFILREFLAKEFWKIGDVKEG